MGSLFVPDYSTAERAILDHIMFTPVSPSVAFFELCISVFFRNRNIRVETLLLVSGSNQIAISNE